MLSNVDIENTLLEKNSILYFIKDNAELKNILNNSKISKSLLNNQYKKYHKIIEQDINKEILNDILDNIVPSYMIIKNKKIIEIGTFDII
jgi:predicted polyphosphate/ATP-dependent NAD kinase